MVGQELTCRAVAEKVFDALSSLKYLFWDEERGGISDDKLNEMASVAIDALVVSPKKAKKTKELENYLCKAEGGY